MVKLGTMCFDIRHHKDSGKHKPEEETLLL